MKLTVALVMMAEERKNRVIGIQTLDVVRTQIEINPHAKKSSGVKYGDLGGQAVRPPLPTQRPGNVSSRNVVTSLWK
jgi:hypothetical protein